MDCGGRARCFFLPPGRILVRDLVVKVVRAEPWFRSLFQRLGGSKDLVVLSSHRPFSPSQCECDGFLVTEDLRFCFRSVGRDRSPKRLLVQLDYRRGHYAVLCKLEKKLGLWWATFHDLSLDNRDCSIYHDAPWDAP